MMGGNIDGKRWYTSLTFADDVGPICKITLYFFGSSRSGVFNAKYYVGPIVLSKIRRSKNNPIF